MDGLWIGERSESRNTRWGGLDGRGREMLSSKARTPIGTTTCTSIRQTLTRLSAGYGKNHCLWEGCNQATANGPVEPYPRPALGAIVLPWGGRGSRLCACGNDRRRLASCLFHCAPRSPSAKTNSLTLPRPIPPLNHEVEKLGHWHHRQVLARKPLTLSAVVGISHELVEVLLYPGRPRDPAKAYRLNEPVRTRRTILAGSSLWYLIAMPEASEWTRPSTPLSPTSRRAPKILSFTLELGQSHRKPNTTPTCIRRSCWNTTVPSG